MPTDPHPLVVGIGEALFDCFGDREVLGGAPLNVAVHADALLRPLGGEGLVATRVGQDELGDRLVGELDSRGMNLAWVQRDEHLPTGRVEVSPPAAGEASYEFLTPSAWDNLKLDTSLSALAGRCAAIAFGALAQRAEASRRTIESFLESAPQALRLFDPNLRKAYYSGAVIRRSLELATAAKLNLDEVRRFRTLLGLETIDSPDAIAGRLLQRYDLDWLAITRGPQGTVLYTPMERHEAEPTPFEQHPDADSVGAGDGCTAGLLFGTLRGWPPARTVTLANRLGAFVASQPGATPRLPASFVSLDA